MIPAAGHIGSGALVLRDLAADDIPAIAAILNAEILTGTASWQSEPRTATEMAAWAEARLAAGYPIVIAELQGTGIAGYASYGRFRDGPGYRHTVEHSVYVAPAARRSGVATALLGRLVADAADAGLHAMIGGVSADQPASIALHEKLGFHEAGRIRQAGAKFGRWLDLVLMQRLLDDRGAPPD